MPKKISKTPTASKSKKVIAPKSKKIAKSQPTKAQTPKDSYSHIASHVLMIEPTQFFLNEETFKDNKFMQRVDQSKKEST
jgi:hypothetical protein